MIVDLILDAFFGVIHWFLGLLPSVEATTWHPGIFGGALTFIQQAMAMANYFLPVSEFFVAIMFGLGLVFVVGFVRWVLRFIPGMG